MVFPLIRVQYIEMFATSIIHSLGQSSFFISEYVFGKCASMWTNTISATNMTHLFAVFHRIQALVRMCLRTLLRIPFDEPLSVKRFEHHWSNRTGSLFGLKVLCSVLTTIFHYIFTAI